MKTDNNNILSLNVDRNQFDASSPLLSSMRFGTIAPMHSHLVLPFETIKGSATPSVEFKPMQSRLYSKVDLHCQTYYGSLRSVCYGIDKFLATPEDVQNYRDSITRGDFTFHTQNAGTQTMPYFTRKELFTHALCAFAYGNPDNSITPFITSGDDDKAYGLRCQIQSSGLFATSNRRNVGPSDNGSSWLGNRCTLFGKHLNYHSPSTVPSGTPLSGRVRYMYNTDPDVVNLARFACARAGWDSAAVALINVVIVWSQYDYSTDTLAFGISARGLDTDELAVGCGYKIASQIRYDGTIENNSHIAYSSSSTFMNRTICFIKGVRSGVRDVFLIQKSVDPLRMEFCTFLNAVFFTPHLFGKGSLCENMGVPMFKRFSFQDALMNGTLLNSPAKLLLFNQKNLWLPAFDEDFGGTIKFDPLKFLIYQKAVRDNYRLPFQVLHNQETFYDSPIFWCLQVPTYIDWNLSSPNDSIFDKGYSNTGYRKGQAITDLDKKYFHSYNKLVSIFLDQAPMLEIDNLTRGWRLQNHDVTTLSDVTPVVNAKVSNKAQYFTRLADRMIRAGGDDQTYEQMISRLAGYKGVKKAEHTLQIEYLGGWVKTLNNEVVQSNSVTLNPDGSMNTQLGDTITRGFTECNDHGSYEFLVPEFGYIVTLFHLSVPNVWVNMADNESRIIAGVTREQFQQSLLPLYQNTGDDPKKWSQFDSFINPANDVTVCYDNKNWQLKGNVKMLRGDMQDLYSNQVITFESRLLPFELTYRWLVRPTSDYNVPFAEKNGDAILFDSYETFYRLSPMSKENLIGLV